MSDPFDAFNIPKAVLLFKRLALLAKKQTFQQLLVPPTSTNVESTDLIFQQALYPATMGPDELVDRMGYGERIKEDRVSPGQSGSEQQPDGCCSELRTRSGCLPLNSVSSSAATKPAK